MEGIILVIGVVFGIIIGATIGIFVGMERMRKAIEHQSVGNLRIDRSEPDETPKPYLEAFTGVTIESIAKEKFVILKVVDESYISHN